jgi:hypothetical protein
MDGETSDQASLIRELSAPLYQCKGWMKLVGVMSILGGALQALTIIGIIIAWLPIWTGILLFQAAGAAELAYQGGNRDGLTRSLSKLKTYFIIMGVLTLIGLIAIVLAFAFGLLGGILSGVGISRA